MKRKHLVVIFCLVFAAFSFCVMPLKKPVSNGEWKQTLPSYITDSIYLDNDNPITSGKIELGRYLFYDRRLSVNKSKSCASCHDPKFSFTDGYRRSIGALGDLHQRNSPPLINLIYKKYLTEADSSFHYPEQQISNPMFHDNPVELGWKGNENAILSRITEDEFYRKKFNEVFKKENGTITIKNIQSCITSFVKTILSFNSPYDKFFYLKQDVLSEQDKRGMRLFFSDKLACRSCHGGDNFDRPEVKGNSGETQFYFNTGLYNTGGNGDYPGYDKGLYEFTHSAVDMGKYRVPVLRNLAFTAPYYHDGSAATLEEVIRNYENGGRLITNGLLKGNGSVNPFKSNLVKGFTLTSQERKDLISFLLCISDSSVLTNRNYNNPFQHDETGQ